MSQSQSFEILLSISTSTHPGSDWDAWVGFRPTQDGFSIWAGTSDPDVGPSRKKIGHRKDALNWRSACRSLLEAEEGRLYGDFRSDWGLRVSGASAQEPELLALCWMTEDDISTDVKEFLISLPSEDLEWLIKALGGKLTSDASLRLIGDYLEFDEESPRARWAEYFPEQKKVDFRSLVLRVEQEHNRRRAALEAERVQRLAPFTTTIDQILAQKSALQGKAGSMWGGIANGKRIRMLEAQLQKHTLENNSLPDAAAVDLLWKDITKVTSFRL